MEKYLGGGYNRDHYYAEESVQEYAYKDDYHYNGGSSVQMKPAQHFNLKPEHGFGHQNSHGQGHGIKPEHGFRHQNSHGQGYGIKPEHGFGHQNTHGQGYGINPEHGYGHQNTHGQGYGHRYEYEHDKCHNIFKDVNDAYSTYSSIRYEKEQYNDPWNRKQGHSGNGGKNHGAYEYQSNAPYSIGGACADGGYGGYGGYGHEGGQGQLHRGYGEEKPFWKNKGIQD